MTDYSNTLLQYSIPAAQSCAAPVLQQSSITMHHINMLLCRSDSHRTLGGICQIRAVESPDLPTKTANRINNRNINCNSTCLKIHLRRQVRKNESHHEHNGRLNCPFRHRCKHIMRRYDLHAKTHPSPPPPHGDEYRRTRDDQKDGRHVCTALHAIQRLGKVPQSTRKG